MNREEHKIQVSCVQWFRLTHAKHARLLFAVPNGGSRNVVEAANLKAEGVLSGVADLLLLVPNKQHHALCVEMKTQKGRQSPNQKEWQQAVEQMGYRYALCRSLDEFIAVVDNYYQSM